MSYQHRKNQDFLASKPIQIMGLILIMLFLLPGCVFTTVGGTEEGVVIKKPWFFGYSGVVEQPLSTGTHFKMLTTDVIKFKTTPFQQREQFIDLISSDRKPVDIDVYVQLRPKQGKSPILYKNFQSIDKAYEDSVSKSFRSAFREAAKRYTMWELVEDINVMRELEKRARESLELVLARKAIDFDVLGVEISKANPPDEVKAEVARTAAQTQRKETELARQIAEDTRKAAEGARALADKEYQTKMNLSSDQYIELMKIDANYRLIDMMAKKKDFTLLVGVDGVAVSGK